MNEQAGNLLLGINQKFVENEVMVRAAWMYYEEELTHKEIGKRLGLSRVKVTRLIQKAREAGIVKIKVVSSVANFLILEQGLRAKFDIKDAHVTIGASDEIQLTRMLANAGAIVLEQRIMPSLTIGVVPGRTITNLVGFFNPEQKVVCTFSAMVGGLPTGSSPDEMVNPIQQLAALSCGKASLIHAPIITSDKNLKDAILRDESVHKALGIARMADMAIFSVGTADNSALLYKQGIIDADDFAEIVRKEAVGDVMGYFYDASGRPIKSSFTDKIVGIQWEELLAIPTKILVAGGESKYAAIRAALRGGLCDILVTDAKTAEWLINSP
jgi:deoxyribonucleoside regulator